MKKGDWKYTYASVTGTSHDKKNTPCQDSSYCKEIEGFNGEKVLIAVVSDGAGSANFSDQGSSLACSFFVEEVTLFLKSGNELKDNLEAEAFIENWMDGYQLKIKEKANEVGGVSIREFACTLVAAVVGNDYAAFFQVGDGAIVCLETDHTEEVYNWEFWPDKGEFENTTYFITDPNVKKYIQFDVLSRSVDELSLFTDGIQHLTLHYQSQTVHSPFFKPMFKALRGIEKEDLDRFNASLTQFLNSDRINEKTDDDKTLLLATRREVFGAGKE